MITFNSEKAEKVRD